jgi:biotin carboxyl carrier protein
MASIPGEGAEMSESWKISGKKFKFPEVDASSVKAELRPGGWVVLTAADGSRRRMMVHEFRGKLSANLSGNLHFGQVQEERRQGAEESGGGDSDLVSQFPGKVRKILVAENEAVAEGAPLVLVEAMKMEFTIKAPRTAKVARILVKEGQQISPGDAFLELA